jgi:hypothetical protein
MLMCFICSNRGQRAPLLASCGASQTALACFLDKKCGSNIDRHHGFGGTGCRSETGLIEAFAAAGISNTNSPSRLSRTKGKSTGYSIRNTQPNLRRSPQRF